MNFSRNHHATPTEIDGIKFASKKEAARYGYLKQFQAAGLIESFEVQPVYPLEPAFRKCCQTVLLEETKKCPHCGNKRPKLFRAESYVGDFLVTLPDGRQIVEDVKGHIKNPLFLSKQKRFERRYSRLSLVIVQNVKEVPK